MELSDVRKTAAYLGIKPTTLYRWATTRKVPHVKLGDRLLFDLEAIRRWVAERVKAEQSIRERWRVERRVRVQHRETILARVQEGGEPDDQAGIGSVRG